MTSFTTMFTVTLRKISSGYKIVAFQLDRLEHAYAISQTLLASPAYSRCYAVCTDWQGTPMFTLQPGGVGVIPPPQMAPPMAPPPPPPPPVYPQYPQALPQQAAYPAYPEPQQVEVIPGSIPYRQVPEDRRPVFDSYSPEPRPRPRLLGGGSR